MRPKAEGQAGQASPPGRECEGSQVLLTGDRFERGSCGQSRGLIDDPLPYPPSR